MQKKHYRIIDETDGSIVANAITTERAAQELAELYSMEYQDVTFTVESYSVVEGE
jgi:precorrin-6B methylase 2